MSWFDTSGFASLAKTALKEAQKTIDKALDIKDEDRAQAATAAAGTSSDFFDTWGKLEDVQAHVKQDKEINLLSQTSIWGSFTGSFFENPKGEMTNVSGKSSAAEPMKSDKIDGLESSRSFPESLSSKIGNPTVSPLHACNSLDELDIRGSTKEGCAVGKEGTHIDEASNRNQEERNELTTRDPLVVRKKEQNLNRLSILSAESDKQGSESVQILSFQSGTDSCTSSPDSEVNSSSQEVNSESVEILPESLVTTSPSSVEVINYDWRSDESPYMSPMDDTAPTVSNVCVESDGGDVKLSSSSCRASCSKALYPSTTSPTSSTSAATVASESGEINVGADDPDEPSLADDSYASASADSTLLLTIVESLQQPDSKQLNKSLDSMKDDDDEDADNDDKSNLVGLHLPVEAITRQPIRNSDFAEPATKALVAAAAGGPLDEAAESPFDRLKCSTTIEPAPCPELKPDSQEKSLTRSSGSEQYLMLTDSSCEETLIGSSSEENAASVSSKQSQLLTSSSYVKSMLAEAMSDKSDGTSEVPARDNNSPISSERSDLVKIGSDQTSGHTSGDELETTTSSDIEIISSPNGDSSSTQSRQSPAKLQSCRGATDLLLTKTLKTRGHSRELSEISVGSDDTNLEIERLLRRIREMTEILEARESKLIEVSRSNMELHEQNSTLKRQLDNVEKHAEHSQDITQITDEYTQRLSALERKFQQAIRERDSLRKSLEQVKQEVASTGEASKIDAEKDEIISELREEGEKLSKQQLQLSNIIKKLRAKEREKDALIKNQGEQMEEQSRELERLKRSLHAKEEVERNQIEAVHALTTKSRKQEKEILSLAEQLDHVTNKMEAYKSSFDAAKAELIEVKEKLFHATEQLKLATENAGESHQLLSQLEDLKLKLRLVEETHASKEKMLKQESTDLLKRLEAAESRNEEMCESVSQATRPLLRQMEQLQSSLTYKSNSFMRQEEAMTEKIADLESKLETITEINRSLSEENVTIKSRCSVLESKLNSRDADRKRLEEILETLKEEKKKLLDETQVHKHAMKMLEEAHATEIKELKREISSLENKLSMEKAATEAEKRRNRDVLVEQQESVDDEQQQRYSPSLDLESVSSANWQAFNEASMFESGRFPNVYDSFSRTGITNSSTSMIENLQAQLKQREGEVQQLQWELSRRNIERDALNTEVSLLASRVEDLNSALVELETIKANLNDVQTKYDALLQMYGEKVEENQELQLDLLDVKEMYKTQIDQLLQRDR